MSETAKNFIAQFHSLPGVTVKEKHQNLFKLLHQNISLKTNPEDLEYITRNLAPTDHLEEIFRVDFFIYFQRFKELHDNFKNGDEITVRKVSKQEWFFQMAFNEVGAADFVNNILPSTSHSLKMKILKKLPLEEQQADEFFDAVCKKYELFLATNLLPKCSSKKIREVIKTQPVKLTLSQLQLIYGKDPDLMYPYFEERTNHTGNSEFLNNDPILIHIAQKNPKMFSELFNKYKFNTSLGRRTTKGYIDSQAEDVLKKPEEYINILNKAATIRKLGADIKGLLFKKSTNQRNEQWQALLKHYPKKKRFAVYRSAHDNVYRHKLHDNLEAMSEEVLEIMEDCDERETFAMRKIEKEDNENYLKYVKPDYCLKKFMEKVNHMKSPERAKYVNIATYCCILNKDVENLLKVCELVCVRFKNDDRAIREQFFYNLTKNKKLMTEFTERHWKLIMEIVATSKAKDEWVYDEQNVVASYLKFLIDNNKPIEEILQKQFEWLDVLSHSEEGKKPDVFKPLLTELLKMGVKKPDPNDELAVPRYYCTLAGVCKDFNERNPKDTFNIYDHPTIRKSVKEMLESETSSYIDHNCLAGVSYIVCQTVITDEMKELKKLYFKAFKHFGNISTLMWFLKHEPKTVEENLDDFLNNFAGIWGINPKRLWRIVKKYSYLELDKRTVDFCRLKLKEEDFEKKDTLIRPLTMLSPPSSHLEFIQSYIPTSDKIDFTNDEAKETYRIQGKLFRMLHKINAPAQVLPVSLELCRGDYLQFALSPLYSCIYRLSENETKVYIEKLDKTKAVSVKKHAMNLTCVLYDADTVQDCLKSATVPSLLATLKYFAKNPSVSLWELINKKINSLERRELQELKSAMSVTVPFEYKSQFVEIIWTTLDKYENKEFKKVLLPKIEHRTIQNFNPDFGINIIRSNIFKLEEANDFIASLLVYLKSEDKFTVLSEILTEFKRNCWDEKELARISRRKLNKFIRILFEKYMKAEEPDQRFAPELSTLFKSIFSLSETFEEWIMVSLLAFKDETPENCAKVIADLNKLFDEKCDKYVISMFATAVTSFVFKHNFTTDSEKIKLCHALLTLGGSVSDQLFILRVLPKKEPDDAESFALYEEIYTKVSQSPESVVQLQFNLYLKMDPSVNTNDVIEWDKPKPRCGRRRC